LVRQADGIRLCEQALAVDPLVEQARRVLIRAYLDVDDPVAAEQLADTSRGDEAVPRSSWRFTGGTGLPRARRLRSALREARLHPTTRD
jgi:hypothetical protein